jgi:hypothetical protein
MLFAKVRVDTWDYYFGDTHVSSFCTGLGQNAEILDIHYLKLCGFNFENMSRNYMAKNCN